MVLKELKVAAAMDEFTHHVFAPECQLLPLSASTWQRQITDFNPDCVFVESAWRGLDESWESKISSPSAELSGLLQWARDREIPTLLWCKEDPVHFSRFLHVASRVDYVFTTDMNCIAQYKRALGHERVYLLPFAVQPALHNPIATVERRDGFSFAGSWYPRYPERQADFRTLIDVARKLKWVDIYDRNGNRPQPHEFAFPEEFGGEIRGTLPYTEMDKGYKGYRYGITVNTVKQSPTMFARRALELMACNTVVVSNFSRGLRHLFGDLVIASDNPAELERRLAPLLADDVACRKFRLQALRKVLSEHTCFHRLAYIADKVLAHAVAPGTPRVAMLAEASSQEEATALIAAMQRQMLQPAALILIAPQGIAIHANVEVVNDRQAAWLRSMAFDYVAPLSGSDYYGRHYLNDMVLATAFVVGGGVTKGAFYARGSDGVLAEQEVGHEYVPVKQAVLRRSLLKPSLLQGWAEDAAIRLDDAQVVSASIVSVDAFSYCAFGAASEAVPAVVDAEDVLHTGSGLLDDTQSGLSSVLDERMILEPADWYPLLPKPGAHFKWDLESNGLVNLRSELSKDVYKYAYLSRQFSRAEVTEGRDVSLIVEGEWQGDWRLVFVFLGVQGQKLSHFMSVLGSSYLVPLPDGTASISMGLRVQGRGRASIGRLSFARLKGGWLSGERKLVVSRQYPDYDDLYRYGFVHARTKAYQQSGVPIEVMRVMAQGEARFREFENVDVVETGIAQLNDILSASLYESVAVHIIDQPLWNTVREHLNRVRVVIWAHGSEIQPWWRRAMNHAPDKVARARQDADERMSMWRDILTLRHPNLSVVFISEKQAMEALSDLRLIAADVGNCAIVHNFINGELFRYVPKEAEQRFNLLSIRPYASAVYANDLTVRAIEDLAREPFFDQLRICIVGDGALFDDTVAPLRRFPNVELSKGFLRQHEIAALHREYGIFLVPSRMDSQGVSRDEAMASGLVPITTRVAAIPEFVDETCGILTAPEDACGVADGVRRLIRNPDDFLAMSRAAAVRVRTQSGYDRTIRQELSLLDGNVDSICVAAQRLRERDTYAMDIALYGDVNLNVMDGSAIWAASLAEVLGGIDGVRVSLVLKARIQRVQVISRLLDLTPSVRLIEPETAKDSKGLTQAEAVAWLEKLDAERPFNAFILRGLEVCNRAAQSPRLAGRIWAYLTDIPQQAGLIDDEMRTKIATIVSASEYILCQTPQMQAYFSSLFPQTAGCTKLLPPMIPALDKLESAVDHAAPFRYCYAGKFAPRWGIRELFEAHEKLLANRPEAELHVFGDKIHNPAADDPGFYPLVQTRLSSGNGLQWHGAVDRNVLMRQLQSMHASWAFRDPVFERETLELSTKVIECASLGVPMILARSPVFESVLGEDYPLFANSREQAGGLLCQLAADQALRLAAAARLRMVAGCYTFDAARQRLSEQGVLSGLARSKAFDEGMKSC